MTKRQRDKLGRLGGAEWVRERIDEAPEPTETPESETGLGFRQNLKPTSFSGYPKLLAAAKVDLAGPTVLG